MKRKITNRVIHFRLPPYAEYIDTHAHYDHRLFRKNREKLLAQIEQDEQIDYVINATIGLQSMFRMREMLEPYSKVLFTVGNHPAWGANETFDNAAAKAHIERFAKEKRTVAIGETGVDTYRCHTPEEMANQEKWMQYFIDLSVQTGKPLILHIRGKDAYKTAIKILRKNRSRELHGVFHCFCESYRVYKKCAALGDFYFGIGGAMTRQDESGEKLRKAVKRIPLERIVLETDAPFIKPCGFDERVNTSFSIPSVIKEIAKAKKTDARVVAKAAYQNSIKLFKLES